MTKRHNLEMIHYNYIKEFGIDTEQLIYELSESELRRLCENFAKIEKVKR